MAFEDLETSKLQPVSRRVFHSDTDTSGNWICAGDGAFNFATDASCIKCQASKSDAAVYEPPKSKLTWRYRSNDKDCTTELPEFTMVLFPYGNPSHERLQDELRLIEGYLRRAHARAFHLNLRPTRLITVVSMYHALRVNGGGDPRPHSSIKLWDEQSFTGTRQVPRVYAHLYAADDDLSKGYISNQATKVVWSEKWTGTYVERIKAALNNPRGTLVEGFFRPHTLPNASAYPINDGLDRLDPQNSVEVTTLRYLRKEVQFKIKAELSKRNCDPKLVATYKARIKQIDMALQGHGWIPATEPNYDLNGLI
ncbi:MAG: hypothetical protein M1834_002747 [Cirrosporium novae-zelandiae]|nr:MAG: hypothetical protein M1834_002747 [Cirrosporium novae-zelandiae]